MPKCLKCGTEFEGNFCPNCGEKWEEEKICPNCGAKLHGSVKFCNECGYSFVKSESASQATQEIAPAASSPQATAPQATAKNGAQSAMYKKLYGIMRLLPSILMTVLTVVNLLFFFADVGSISMMGESEGIGNVYKVLGNGPDEIKAVITALLVVDIVVLVLSLISLYFTFNREKRAKIVTIANKSLRITDILAVCAILLSLIIFIIACIACGKISGLSEGVAMLGAETSPSAGVILALIFSLLFAIAIAGCVIGRIMLAKKNPQLKEEENVALQAGVAKAEAQSMSTAGDYVAELEPEEQLRTLQNVKVVTGHLAALKFTLFTFIALVFPMAIIIIFIAPFIGLNAKYSEWKPEKLADQRKSLKKFSIVYGIFGAIMTVFIIVFAVDLAEKVILLMSLPQSLNWVYGLINAIVWIFAFTFILAFALCLITYVPLRKLEMTFYGVKKPSVVLMKPRYDVSTFFVTQEKVKRNEIACSKPKPDFVKLVQIIALYVLALIIFLVYMNRGSDFIFDSTKYVEKIKLGDDYRSIISAIGPPDASGSSNAGTEYWYYYSENMLDITGQIDKLKAELKSTISDDRETAINRELSELEEKASTIKSIKICMSSSTNSYMVNSVLFANKKYFSSGDSTGYSAPAVSNVELKLYNDIKLLYKEIYEAKVWFSDGSYHYSYVLPSIVPSYNGYVYSWTDDVFGIPVTYNVAGRI